MTGFASLPDLISALGGQVIRNTTRWVFNSAGVLVPVAPNQIAFDHDPVTLARRGIPFEPARTNQFPNSVGVGAVAGSPGTLPTGWAGVNITGFTRTILEPYVQRGISHLTVRHQGVPDTSANGYNFGSQSGGGGVSVTAAPDQVWTFSIWLALLAGDFTGVTQFRLIIDFRDSTNTVIRTDSTDVQSAVLAAGPNTNRYSFTSSPAPTNTARVQARVIATSTVGVTMDNTIAYGLPQLELGAFATSTIPTTGTALTRDADILVLPLGTWHRLEEHLLVARLTPIANVAEALLMQIWDGASFTAGGGIRLRQGSTPTATAVDQRGAGGVDRGTLVTGNAAAGVLRRIAYRRSAAGAARLVTSSGAAVTGTGVDASPAVSQLRIGGGQAAFHLRGLRFEPVIPTDAAMDALVA